MDPIENAQVKCAALRTLGLAASATPEEFRTAWRRAAFDTHPDRNGGELSEFVKAKAAYDYLTGETSEFDSTGAVYRDDRTGAPGNVGRRPNVATRIIDFSNEQTACCRAFLDDNPANSNAAIEAPESAKPAQEDDGSIDTTDHVPSALRRKGRCLTHIIHEPLTEGTNRVALPASVLEDHRKVNPKIVTFRAGGTGPGEIDIPDELRKKLFPGARSVRIGFAKT